MNEALSTNANGLRLIAEFEGAPRLTARLCEGGAWELGYGVTFNLDGAPFKDGDTCTPEYADALFRHALKLFEDGVRELVTVPLTSDEFSAVVAFAYNVGLENLRGSTVLRRINENRMDDAAAAFGMWIFATKGGRKQAYRGLLRRRYAEALLFMGYDWGVATADTEATNPVSLQAAAPDTLPGTDRVIYKTPFKSVLAVAQRYPLAPADELVLSQPAPPLVAATRVPEAMGAAVAPTQPVQPPSSAPKVSPAPTLPPAKATVETIPAPPAPRPTSLPPAAQAGGVISYKSGAAQAPQGPVVVTPPKPPALPTQVGTKPPSVNTKMPEHVPYRVDPTAGLKPMEETERFVGAALMLFGTFARVIMANTTALTGVGGIIVVAILDMMKSPTNLAILITVFAMAITGILWVFAFIVDKLGFKIKKRGEATSTQAMY